MSLDLFFRRHDTVVEFDILICDDILLSQPVKLHQCRENRAQTHPNQFRRGLRCRTQSGVE